MVRTRQETILSAPTIVCGGCTGAIKNALGKLGGVEAVEVDVATKRVSVAHDSCVTRERLVEALDDAGFPAQ